MSLILIQNATAVATQNDARTEWKNASILVRNQRIEWVGPDAELPAAWRDEALSQGEVLDARGHLVVPGFVNTHHHMYQTLTRVLP